MGAPRGLYKISSRKIKNKKKNIGRKHFLKINFFKAFSNILVNEKGKVKVDNCPVRNICCLVQPLADNNRENKCPAR